MKKNMHESARMEACTEEHHCHLLLKKRTAHRKPQNSYRTGVNGKKKDKSWAIFSFYMYVMLDLNTLHLWLQVYSSACSQVGWICMHCGAGAAHSRFRRLSQASHRCLIWP